MNGLIMGLGVFAIAMGLSAIILGYIFTVTWYGVNHDWSIVRNVGTALIVPIGFAFVATLLRFTVWA